MKKIFITENQLKNLLAFGKQKVAEYECLNEASSSMGGMRMNAIASKLTFQQPTKENTLVNEGIDRTELECDPTRKQLIPYALLFDADGRILSYSRNGSEERLRRRRSVGFGGHVNDKDEGNSLLEILCSGLLRELNEEVGLQISTESLNLLGVINEEVSAVGLSHTGIVFKVELSSKDFSFDGEIQSPHWGECGDVKEDDFELWSVLALKLAKRFEKK